MFLSKLELDPSHWDVQRDIADAAQMHRTVMRGFPQRDGDGARAAFGVLFRLEASEWQSVVIVQSAVEPDWGNLPDGYLVTAERKSIDSFLASINADARYRFRLLANPTRKVAVDTEPPRSGYNSRRKAIVDEEGRLRWLTRRAETSGFAFAEEGGQLALRQVNRPPIGRGGRGRNALHVRPVLFEGRLKVVDVDSFRNAIETGIGPAKAYGCGLLSIG